MEKIRFFRGAGAALAVLTLSNPCLGMDEQGPSQEAAAPEPVPPAPAPVPSPEPAPARAPWFRNSGEYLATRSTRLMVPSESSSKIVTDFKRFDVSLGKRFPLHSWGGEGLDRGWAVGVDGGMLASLVRYTSQGRLTFATNTFDGMFGAFLAFHNPEGWLALFRTAHLSAHLVDNSPQFLSPIGYSQFWNEIIVGKSFPAPASLSRWELHLQGSLGLNNTSTPVADQPRATVGADFGYTLCSPDSLAAIASADVLRAGVQDQPASYTYFLGLGYLSRPYTTHRPFRFGVVHFRGSDYRNQRFFLRHIWTAFQMAAEF